MMAKSRTVTRSVLSGTLLLVLALPGIAAAQQVNWEKVSPGFAGQKFLNNDKVCADCHAKVSHTFDENAHQQFFKAGTTALKGTCESCHGPRSRHADDEKKVAPWQGIPADQQSGICMQCHAGGDKMHFKAGPHMNNGVSCTSCHDGKHDDAGTARLASLSSGSGAMSAGSRAQTVEKCYSCHAGVRGQMSKASHHPVREGKMDCLSCHNVHGSNPSLLKTSTVNETCYSCHTEKRGPFVFEHAPVRESCASCHDAHGTTNRKLLNQKESFLCLSCHSYGGHINLPRYNRTSNPYGDGCVNCHVAVHGSTHPSGAKLTR